MEENTQKEAPEKSQEQNQESSSKVNDDKLFAALSYFGILCLIPLLTKKDNAFVFFHAKQGLILLIVAVLGSFLAIIPLLGWVLSPIILLGTFILFIIGILNVLGGKTKKLPLIGQFADSIKI